jgi:hypothetical protein
MTDAPTAPAMPTLADPGELGPSIAPATAPATAPKPAPVAEHAQTYEQRREAQDAANAAAKPEAAAKPADEARVEPQAPGEKVKVGKYEVSEAELASMMDRQAQEDLKKATLPAAPEAYEAKLPEGLKLPEGVEYQFDVNNPTLIAARNLAHSKGWSQQDFSEALALYAGHIAGEQAMLAERSAAEIAKVGINAPQRVSAVNRFVIAEMGEADAKQINALIVTDSMLRYHEKIMQKLSSQGTASFSQSHRVAPETGGIPGYEKMSFEQRRQAQDQNAARRR